MAISDEIQSLSPSAIIELFVLDTTNMSGGSVLRFHSGISSVQTPIRWQGQVYEPLPIESEGFDLSVSGALPRPKVRVANVEGLLSAMVSEMDDLIGCRLIRKRTLARFLDSSNFPNGNPDADPHQSFPDQIWFFDQKTSETKYMIEWELASAFDLQGVMLPLRQVIQNSCPWRYRGSECGYTGQAYDKADNITWDSSKDACSKTLNGCRVRFQSGVMPFGGFPGVQRDI